ncbi:GcvT family protein [Leifsonia sp. 2MCAF36]|uniref:GcvT family protein n=1 Tax=Leifsonia sp. 2MCAF36 TaxID=3232988 RepID=UPI003F97147C
MERLVDKSISGSVFTDSTRDPLPARAKIVIVGGGIVGSSVAYHLAAAGEKDVLLLEANVLGSGTSWHAAGLVTGARGNSTLTKLAQYGLETYVNLEDKSGIEVNFTRAGSLSIARTPGRLDEITYARDVARQHGVPTEMLDAKRFAEVWPLAGHAGVLGSLLLPDDGHVNPGWATIAFAKLAWESGVRIREATRVTEILVRSGRAVGVRTAHGDIEADQVVLTGGLWSRDLAATAGAHVPLYAAEHVHVRTNPIEGAVPQLPVFRDLDNSYYLRHELGRILVGAFEPDGLPRPVAEISQDGFAEFGADWQHFAPIRTEVEKTVRAIGDAGYDRFLNAPESFTPDANFAIGETGEVDGLFVAAGMNSQGIIYAPAVGRELADWMIAGAPQFDAYDVDVRRFSTAHNNRRFLHDRTKEGLGRLYAMHWPQLQMSTGRGVRRTPLHDRLKSLGASFGELGGWERANWYETSGATPTYEYSYGRANWFDRVREEHSAAREGVALFDLTPFAKIEVAGPDALAVVQRTFTANMDVEIDKAVYTLQLNEHGGIELDGTVTRLAEDRFLVVTPSATQQKTLSILRRATTGSASSVFDATAAYATIAVMGPKSRELLERVSPEDWSDEAQKYTYGRRVEIAHGFAYALRVSFVGELGYELYVSSDLALNVFDALWEAGQDLGLRLAGYFALDTLRSEKGFRHLGHDIGQVDDPYAAGLRFTLDMEKPGGFVGRDAVAALDPSAPKHRTVYFAVDDPRPVLVHDETLFLDGDPIGRATSGNYGHTLGRAVGIAAIEPDADLAGAFSIECKGTRYPVTVSRRPLYDPTGSRMKS